VSPEIVRKLGQGDAETQPDNEEEFDLLEDSDGEIESSPLLTPGDGWMLPVCIEGVYTAALIDTGSSVSLMSPRIYELMKLKGRGTFRKTRRRISTVGNESFTPIGQMEVQMEVANQKWPINMLVMTDRSVTECLLGLDFINAYNCDMSLRNGTFNIGNHQVPMIRESVWDRCARVKLTEDVRIPARSETILTGKPDRRA
jgi:hypothetical protein